MNENSPPESLKVACPSCAQRIDATGAAPFSRAACPSCGKPFTVPLALDGFLALEPLGSGRVSAVYRGLEAASGRAVAVKLLLRPAAEAPKRASRFLEAARRNAALSDPRIVPVSACGESGDSAYAVQPLLEGASLAALMRERRGPAAVADCLHVARDVAQALDAAARQGAVHGNLSPNNIFLDAAGNASVADFGFADSAWDSARDCRENVGACHSTVAYLSPEAGLGGTCDVRSDIYSLGAILYHLLCGVPPFADENTGEEFRHRQAQSAPPLPRHVRVPERVALLLDSMLAGAPEARPQGHAAVLIALEELLTSHSKGDEVEIVVMPPGRGKRGRGKKTGARPAAAVPASMGPRRGAERSLLFPALVLLLVLPLTILLFGALTHAPWYVSEIEPRLRAIFGGSEEPLAGPSEPDFAQGTAPDPNKKKAEPPPPPPPHVDDPDMQPPPPPPPPDVSEPEPEPEPPEPPAPPVEPLPGHRPRLPTTLSDNLGEVSPYDSELRGSSDMIDPTVIVPRAVAAEALGTVADNSPRPRPDDLNFTRFAAELETYFATLPETERKQEQARAKMIAQLRDEWVRAKVAFDGSKGLLLKNGKTVYGTVMASEERLVMLRPSQDPLMLSWGDISVLQYIRFLENHLQQKAGRLTGSDRAKRILAVGEDYFRLAVLCDWYGIHGEAGRFAAEGVRLNPDLLTPSVKFIPGYAAPAPESAAP